MVTLARKLSARILRHHAPKGSLDLRLVSFGASLLAMQASIIITTASIWTLEGLLESRWSLVATVRFLGESWT